MAEPRPVRSFVRSFDANVQSIASAAHLRGVVLVRSERIVGSLEAAVLCRTLRTAHEATRGNADRHDHVERLANGIAAGLARRLEPSNAVLVSQSVWNLVHGYANPNRRPGPHPNPGPIPRKAG